MNVMVKETREVVKLEWIAGGTNIIRDMVGNYDGFGNEPHQFKPADEVGYDFEASAETIEWWEKVAREGEALDDRIAALKDEHGDEAVNEVVNAASDVDLEDLAASVNRALDEAFGE